MAIRANRKISLDQLDEELRQGLSREQIEEKYQLGKGAYPAILGRLRKRQERRMTGEPTPSRKTGKAAGRPKVVKTPINGAAPYERPPERPTLLVTDDQGIFWAGWFSAIGQIDLKVTGTENGHRSINVTARITTRKLPEAQAFFDRYGGTWRDNDSMYAVILDAGEPGLHRLITDLAATPLSPFATKAIDAREWLEYKFYLSEQERVLIDKYS